MPIKRLICGDLKRRKSMESLVCMKCGKEIIPKVTIEKDYETNVHQFIKIRWL